MGFQLQLLGFGVFLLLTLSFCHGKNETVKVIGVIHCTDCIRHEFSSSQASLGIKVFIRCKSGSTETNRQGNGAVDREGKFNVTLSAEIKKDGNSIDGCFAKLQSASAAPCPIQSAQTASVKLLSTEEKVTQAAHNKPTLIKFSPVTCQSAFFWPFIKLPPQPNVTVSPTLPPTPGQPMGYAPSPSQALPPPASAVQPPLPPVENSIPPPAPASPPSYLPPIPSLPPTIPPAAQEFGNTSPPPDLSLKTPPPSLTSQSPQRPPNHRKPNPIPRAPPVPSLPPIPTVPRKYFNPPKSKSEPPHFSYPSHS